MSERKAIGHVIAQVKFPIYEGDKVSALDGPDRFPWFEYREPGLTDKANIGCCTRQCETLSVNIELNESCSPS